MLNDEMSIDVGGQKISFDSAGMGCDVQCLFVQTRKKNLHFSNEKFSLFVLRN